MFELSRACNVVLVSSLFYKHTMVIVWQVCFGPSTFGIPVPAVSLLSGSPDMFAQELAYDFNGFLGNSVFSLTQDSIKFLYSK